MSSMWEVVIIGGGPAGATAATFLAKQGHSVVVLEKEKFPREHVGESLLPFCYHIFQQLGVLDEMTKRFVRKPGVRFVDVDGTHHTTWCFGHVIKDASHLSFHVLRAEFDQLLLNNARKHGVTVKEQTKVQSIELGAPDDTVEVSTTGPRGGKRTYRARFLLDASGRDTFVASRMGWKKPHKELDRTALSTHWTGGQYIEGIEEGLLQIVYLGGDKKGWIWLIPVGTDRISAGVVLNHAYIRQEKAKLKRNGVKDWQLALYRKELMSSDFVRGSLSGARIAQPLMFNGNYSYTVEHKFGDNYALIGDASTFIDPIFASGVYLSMNSARLVSDALHKQLSTPNGKGDGHLEQAYNQINGAYTLVDKAIQIFYNPVAINFAEMGSAVKLIERPQQKALDILHYLLAGDFFERHAQYNRVLDLLQDPKLYAKYRRLIGNEKLLQQTPSCGIKRSTVFPSLLEENSQNDWDHPEQDNKR